MQSIILFLAQANDALPTPVLLTSPRALPSGGLKLPPFPPRARDENNPNEAPKSILTADDANEYKEIIFKQLDEFDGYVHKQCFPTRCGLHPAAFHSLYNACVNLLSILASTTR
jgi:hypothetical protein